VKRFTVIFLFVISLLFQGCGEVPAIVTEDENPVEVGEATHDLPTRFTPTPNANELPRYGLDDVIIVIDNSYSIVNSGCDQQRIRYSVADFFVRIVDNWKESGLVSEAQNTKLIFLDRKDFVLVEDGLHDELLKRLEPDAQNDESGSYHGLAEIFDEWLVSNANQNSVVVFLTDGDFRTSIKKNQPEDSWSQYFKNVLSGVSSLVTQKNIKMNFLLLCTDQLLDADFDGVDDTIMEEKWNQIDAIAETEIYRIQTLEGQVFLSTEQKEILERMLENIFILPFLDTDLVNQQSIFVIPSKVNAALLYGTNTSVDSQILRGGGILDVVETQEALLGYSAFISAGIIPFDFSAKPHVYLNDELYDYRDFLPYTPKYCSQNLYFDADSDFSFVWWQTIVPQIEIDEDILKIINHQSVTSPIKLSVPGKNGKIDITNKIQWNEWEECMFFNSDLDNVTVATHDSRPELIFSFPTETPSLVPTVLPITLSWGEEQDSVMGNLQSWQSLELKYVRYFVPTLREVKRDNKVENTSGINLDFGGFHPELYDVHHRPTLTFSSEGGSSCNLSKDYYPETMAPWVSFSRNERGYVIRFASMESVNYEKCEKLYIDWPEWFDSDITPPKNIVCDLVWENNYLDKIEKCE
jgi:hypothetical protein